MGTWTVGASRRDEAAEAGEALSHAMRTNPNHVAVWGEDERARRRQQALMTGILAGTRPADVLVARSDGRIVGVLRMVDATRCQLSTRQQLRMLPGILATQKGSTGRLLGWLRTWSRHDPDEAHWHLGPVGVLPDRQGGGVGSALMEAFVARVDDDGSAAYLETDKPENVGFYERFGFETTGEDQVHGVDNWFMWRAARP